MTIQKAKEILGAAAESLEEKDIQDLINSFSFIVEVGLEQFENQQLQPKESR